MIGRARRRSGRFGDLIVRLSPPAVLALLYLGLAIAGTAALMLPVSTVRPIGLADAAFTAISAATVTGLVTLDIGSQFSLVGECIILLLIQLGGLGIMAFTVLVLSLLGRPLKLRDRMMLKEDLNQTSFHELGRLVLLILRLVILCEALGTAFLALRFVPSDGWGAGIWLSLFHAVSAFNNAGFVLFEDSLMGFVDDPLVTLAIAALFIVGGLGFTVLFDIGRERRWRRLSVHSKLMLTGSLALALMAFALFLALEWNNAGTLGPLSWETKLLASFFQSVTPRTAGFNTLDIGATEDSTALMLISLMLIGGGSTSTAGGIKVTSFMVLLIATVAFLRRRSEANVFGRRLPQEDIFKVLALTVLSLLVVMTGIFLITMTHEAPFLDISFEVASAFALTGLSRGLTSELNHVGYVVIGALMLIGRIGPLALGFILATAASSHIRYPEGRVYLG